MSQGDELTKPPLRELRFERRPMVSYVVVVVIASRSVMKKGVMKMRENADYAPMCAVEKGV
jgi:hypothetical protein